MRAMWLGVVGGIVLIVVILTTSIWLSSKYQRLDTGLTICNEQVIKHSREVQDFNSQLRNCRESLYNCKRGLNGG